MVNEFLKEKTNDLMNSKATLAQARWTVTPRFTPPTRVRPDYDVLRTVRADFRATNTELRQIVQRAGDEQRDLTEAIHRCEPADRRLRGFHDRRRRAHLSLILGRAVLLTRPRVRSLSMERGEEARIDDLNVLSRATSLLGELRHDVSRHLRRDIDGYLVEFETAGRRLSGQR